MSLSVLPMFSSKSFIVSGLTFRSLIHLSLSLCMVLRSVLVSFFYISCPVFQAPFIEEAVFAPLYIPLLKIRYPQVHGLISGLSVLFHWSMFLFLCQCHTVLMTVGL